jgi:hypothetical protein
MTTRPAFELIGHEGSFRLPGGRSLYDAVMYDDARAKGSRPRLARLEARDGGLHQVNRYVDWEQPIEVLVDYDEDEETQDSEPTTL